MRYRIVAAFCLAMLAAACNHDGTGVGAVPSSSARSPVERMETLLDLGNAQGAIDVYDSDASYFATLPAAQRTILRRVADARAAQLREPARAATEALIAARWPGPVAEWPQARQRLQRAAEVLARYDAHKLFELDDYRPGERAALAAALAAAREQCTAALGRVVEQAGLAALPRYPLDAALGSFIAAHPDSARARLAALSDGELAALVDAHREQMSDAQLRELGTLLVQTPGRDTGGDGFGGALSRMRTLRAAGVPVDSFPDVKVAFVDLSSPALAQRGAIQFPVTVDVDLPVRTVSGASLEAALDDPLAGGADVLVLVNVTAARATRDVVRYETVKSEYRTGTRTVPNPRYDEVRRELIDRQLKLQQLRLDEIAAQRRCRSGPCLGASLAGLAAALSEGKLQDEIADLTRELAGTRAWIDEPVHADYAFRKADIEARKTAAVRLHVVDRKAGRYLRDTVDLSEVRRFTVAYRLAKDDRHRERHLAGLSSEDEVVEFERAAITVTLSSILDSYRESGASAPAPGPAALRTTLLAERNAALAAAAGQVYAATAAPGGAAADGIGGVVAVYNPSGGLGSGFYVRDDLVLTNEHVVAGSQFAELRRHDGVETFGKVVAADARRDLALIQVQARGQPLRFFAGQDLPLGGTVFAIGHPEGLEFTVTRGIISAVRPLPSLNMPGADRLLFVQTDTAISPGNSGGPLLLDGRVVGVNTWKLAKTDVEGLSFSLHFAEVLAFLRLHGAGPGGGT